MSLARKLARALLRHAAQTMPPARADWAAAMAAEGEAIARNADALQWALGCVVTSYGERIGAMDKVHLLARFAVAMPAMGFGVSKLLPLAMILAYRARSTGMLERLEGAAAGDDWRRFAPLMEAMPDWLLVVSAVTTLLFITAGVALLLNRAFAPWLLAGALALQASEMAIHHNGLLYKQVFSAGELRMDWIIFAVLMLMTCAAFVIMRAKRANVS